MKRRNINERTRIALLARRARENRLRVAIAGRRRNPQNPDNLPEKEKVYIPITKRPDSKLPIKRKLADERKRSPKIDRYFKTKSRFKEQAFLEINVQILFKGEKEPVQAYGYSKEFKASNDAQNNANFEKAKNNAIVNAYYQVGGQNFVYEDIDYIDSNEIESFKITDHFYYYLNTKDEKITSYKTKKGNTVIRFYKNGKLARGGGLEQDKQQLSQEFDNLVTASEAGKNRLTPEELAKSKAKKSFIDRFS